MAEQRPVMLGLNPRQRFESERDATQRIPVIKAVTTVTNSNVTLWTVTANKFLKLNDFSVCNISGTNITITVYVVPSGGSAAAGNKVYDAFALGANDSGTLGAILGHTFLPGDFIVAVTNHATGANFWLDGGEFTGGLP